MKKRFSLRMALRLAARFLLIGIATLAAAYIALEAAVTTSIRKDLERVFGNDYAVLLMHIGGEPVESIRLYKLLYVLYDYNFTDRYPGEGSGNFTGKKHYIIMLVSDNRMLRIPTWSFRKFSMDWRSRPGSDDMIENLFERDVPLYTYTDDTRVKRQGIWYKDEGMNHPALGVYGRHNKLSRW
jgi:hypothetical protein